MPLLGGCASEAPPDGTDSGETAAQRGEALMQAGPYGVGYRQVQLRYPPAASEADRGLQVEVWYPTDETDGETATYRVAGFVTLEVDGVLTRPEPADTPEPWPVAVYSHGNGGLGLVGYPFGHLLASHGWIVVAPDHTGNTALDYFFDRAVPIARSALDRPQDLSAVLDWLADVTEDPLTGKADPDTALVFGHSFGGYTALATGGATPSLARFGDCPDEANPNCEIVEDPDAVEAFANLADDRALALVAQAPAIGFFEPSAISAVELPVMLQTGRRDQTTTQETSAEPTWDALDGPDDVWVEMPRGGHLSFLSICDDLEPDVLDVLQPGAEDDGCGPGFIDASAAVPVLAGYLRGFAEEHVLGNAEWRDVVYGPAWADGFVTTTP